MDRLFRSNSFASSRSSVPPDIINEEDYSVEETDFTDFKKSCIPKVDTKSIYRTSWVQSTFNSQFSVRIVEETYSISRTHEKCCLFNRRSINDFLAKKSSYLHARAHTHTHTHIYCVENRAPLPGVAWALIMMISALLWPI